MSDITTGPPPAVSWRAGAATLRLSLAEFAAVATRIPDLALPEGFRPGQQRVPITSPEIAQSLADAGLLLRNGDDVVLCPQLAGLLRLFARAAVKFRLRVRLRDPADDTQVRWLTDVALAEGRGARLTRATVLGAGAGRPAGGAMDGDTVAIAGFSLAETVPQLVGCVPALESLEPQGRPHREVIDVVDFAARPGDQELGASTLEICSAAGQFVDVWSRDSHGWRRVVPDGAGRLALIAVSREVFAAQLTDVLSDSVLMDGSGTEPEHVDGSRGGN